MTIASPFPPTNPVAPPLTDDGAVGRYKAIALVAVGLTLLGCTVGVLVPAGLGWDFANFYDAGRRIAAGQAADLYQAERAISGLPPQGVMRFWGAPISAALFAPLASMSPGAALVAFKLQNTLAIFLGLWLLYRHCRRFAGQSAVEQSLFAASFATVGFLYQPFWTVFRVGGQTTPTVFLLLVVALLFHAQSRFHLSAWLLAIAALIKPGLAPMLVFLACVSGWAFTLALAESLAFFGVLSLVLMGWPIHREFLGVLQEGSQFSRGWQYNSSLYVPLENFRFFGFVEPATSLAGRVLTVATLIIKLAVVAMFVAIMRRSRRMTWPAPARRHFEFLMAALFWLLVSQIVWEHYLSILFIPLAYCLATARMFPASARRMIAAIFVLCLAQNLAFMEFLWTRVDPASPTVFLIAGAVKAGPLLVTLALLWRHQGSLFSGYESSLWRDSQQEQLLGSFATASAPSGVPSA